MLPSGIPWLRLCARSLASLALLTVAIWKVLGKGMSAAISSGGGGSSGGGSYPGLSGWRSRGQASDYAPSSRSSLE